MRATLANLNYCAVLLLSRAAVNLSWYDYINIIIKHFSNTLEEHISCQTSCLLH